MPILHPFKPAVTYINKEQWQQLLPPQAPVSIPSPRPGPLGVESTPMLDPETKADFIALALALALAAKAKGRVLH